MSSASTVMSAVPQLSRYVLASAPVPRSSGAHGVDRTWFLDINSFARSTPWLHGFMLFYAVTGGIIVCMALLVIGWWLARRRGDAKVMAASLWAPLGTMAAVGVAQPINHAVAEARPWQSLPGALILAGHTVDYSFPSDHAVMAGAVIAGLFLYNRLMGVLATVAGVVLCFGRVYIGAHYPQDVAAGLLIGAVVVLVGWAIVRIPLTAAVAYFARTPARVLLSTAGTPMTAAGGPAGARAADASLNGQQPAAGQASGPGSAAPRSRP